MLLLGIPWFFMQTVELKLLKICCGLVMNNTEVFFVKNGRFIIAQATLNSI